MLRALQALLIFAAALIYLVFVEPLKALWRYRSTPKKPAKPAPRLAPPTTESPAPEPAPAPEVSLVADYIQTVKTSIGRISFRVYNQRGTMGVFISFTHRGMAAVYGSRYCFATERPLCGPLEFDAVAASVVADLKRRRKPAPTGSVAAMASTGSTAPPASAADNATDLPDEMWPGADAWPDDWPDVDAPPPAAPPPRQKAKTPHQAGKPEATYVGELRAIGNVERHEGKRRFTEFAIDIADESQNGAIVQHTGRDLERCVKEAQVKVGDRVRLDFLGRIKVPIQKPDPANPDGPPKTSMVPKKLFQISVM